MRIVITGSGGLLGRECVQVLGPTHELFPLTSTDLDITDLSAVEAAITRLRPDLVLNCAAFSGVDAAETEREQAYQVNAVGPRNLAQTLALTGGKLVHLSTDYVFDGKKPLPEAYVEEDATGPLSWYGQTKLEGEAAVMGAMEDYIIVRTAWLFGIQGKSFLKTMLKLALKQPPAGIRVVDDQHSSPTWALRLAQQLARLIEAGGRGLYHATAEGSCNRYELALLLFEQMGIDCRVAPCASSEFPAPAVRPYNSIMENRRLKEAGLNLMRPWDEDVAEFVARFKEELLTEAKSGGSR